MAKQKMFRKSVILTDAQISRLKQLSEFDGQDVVFHVKKALDEYLKNQKPDLVLPKEDEILAEITQRYNDPEIVGAVWISGNVNQYEFSALLFHAGSKTGIDRGKISKLSIWDPVVMENTKSFINSCIVNYDRGWDIRPSKIAQPYYDKVKGLIDHSFE
jgi:hypothetical protein